MKLVALLSISTRDYSRNSLQSKFTGNLTATTATAAITLASSKRKAIASDIHSLVLV